MTKDGGHEAVDSFESAGETNPTGTRGWQFMFLIAAAAIVILSGILYRPSMHGGLVWDDTFLVKGTGLGGANTIFQCFHRGFLWNYFRPLTGASFVLEHRYWHLNTYGYHLTNVIIHVLTTAIFIPVLLAGFRSRRVALAGAFLFAAQPIQVSTVAWIGGRTDSLCTLFIAIFWLALIQGARSSGDRRTALLSAAFVCFAAAASAKEQALAMIPLVPLALYNFRSRSDGGLRSQLASQETGAGDAASPISPPCNTQRASVKEMTIWTIPYLIFAPCLLLAWKKYGDPIHPHWNFGFQLPAIGRTIVYYTELLTTPTPRLLHTWTLGSLEKVGPLSILTGYILAVVAIAAFVRWMRTEPELAWFFAGALLLLIPVSNVFPLVTQVVAPYRAGTAGLGAAAVAGWAAIRLVDLARSSSSSSSSFTWRPVLVAIPLCIYGLWLATLTRADTYIWTNQLRASEEVEQCDPTSTFGTLEVAASYLDLGQTEPAVSRLDKMVESVKNKQYTIVRSDSALWWMYGGYPADWIGELYGRAGEWKLDHGDRDSALLLLNKGVVLAPSNEYVRAGLANCAFAVQDVDGGIEQFRILLRYRPKLTDDRIVLSRVLLKLKRWQEADDELIACLDRRPNDKSLYILDAYARIESNNWPGARAVLEDGIRNETLDPALVKQWLASIGESAILN